MSKPEQSTDSSSKLQKLLELYDRLSEQDPKSNVLEYLLKEINALNPDQTFDRDILDTTDSLAAFIGSVTARHLHAVRRAQTIEETLPIPEDSLAVLHSLKNSTSLIAILSNPWDSTDSTENTQN